MLGVKWLYHQAAVADEKERIRGVFHTKQIRKYSLFFFRIETTDIDTAVFRFAATNIVEEMTAIRQKARPAMRRFLR
jgi:hypothetical protein